MMGQYDESSKAKKRIDLINAGEKSVKLSSLGKSMVNHAFEERQSRVKKFSMPALD